MTYLLELVRYIQVGEPGRPGASVARYLGVATSTVNRHAAVGGTSTLSGALLEAVRKEV